MPQKPQQEVRSANVQDWRGNTYALHGIIPGVACEAEGGCPFEARRLVCTAEGDSNRTHHHGGIHGKKGLRHYCLKHGKEYSVDGVA